MIAMERKKVDLSKSPYYRRGGSALTCPTCGRRLMAERTETRANVIIRYRECITLTCDYAIVTSQERTEERVIRKVDRRK